MLKCSTSLWSADRSNLGAEIRRVEPYSERFHLDVADGHYVKNLLFFPDQVKALLEGQIDVGFLARCEARFENELALEAVGEIGLVAALPPEHALTTPGKVPLRNLANEKLVVLKESLAPATHDWIRDLCRANGFEPKLCGSAISPRPFSTLSREVLAYQFCLNFSSAIEVRSYSVRWRPTRRKSSSAWSGDGATIRKRSTR